MKRNPDNQITQETSQLLADLDQALDISTAVCEIARKREQLHLLETVTGPSPYSRLIRKEIWQLEQQLRADRIDAGLAKRA